MMTELPDTRESLLLRVCDPANAEAWREFAAIYRPAVYRLARRRGLQDADAEDLAQRVLVVVSRKIADWRPTSPRGAWRGWPRSRPATTWRRRSTTSFGGPFSAGRRSGFAPSSRNQPGRRSG